MTFRPLNVPPPDHDGERRYVHVIGASIFVDDRPADERWDTHFVGVVDDVAWWAVDVPPDADDPSYGASLDLRAFFGRAPEHHWLAASSSSSGRAPIASAVGAPPPPSRPPRSVRCGVRRVDWSLSRVSRPR